MPEEDTSLRGYTYSLSCKCDGDKINFVTRSYNQERLRDNWRSPILGTEYRHYVQHLKEPEADVFTEPSLPFTPDDFDSDPLRRYIRATGGHCSGGGGCC